MPILYPILCIETEPSARFDFKAAWLRSVISYCFLVFVKAISPLGGICMPLCPISSTASLCSLNLSSSYVRMMYRIISIMSRPTAAAPPKMMLCKKANDRPICYTLAATHMDTYVLCVYVSTPNCPSYSRGCPS